MKMEQFFNKESSNMANFGMEKVKTQKIIIFTINISFLLLLFGN